MTAAWIAFWVLFFAALALLLAATATGWLLS